MSLGNYKILNPSRTFRLGLIFFSSLFRCFPFDQFRKRSSKWMVVKNKKAPIIKTVPSFVMILDWIKSQIIKRDEVPEKLPGTCLRSKRSKPKGHGLKHTREWRLNGIFIPEHKVLWALCLSTVGAAHLCKLLSMRSLAPFCPSEITEGSTANCPNHYI